MLNWFECCFIVAELSWLSSRILVAVSEAELYARRAIKLECP